MWGLSLAAGCQRFSLLGPQFFSAASSLKAWLLSQNKMAYRRRSSLILWIFVHSFSNWYCDGNPNKQDRCQARTSHYSFTSRVWKGSGNLCADLSFVEEWKFADHSLLVETFPVDKESRNYVRRVRGSLFSVVQPVPLQSSLYLVAVSSDVLTEILDMRPAVQDSRVFLEFVAGNRLLPNSKPLSHRYGGHQVFVLHCLPRYHMPY